MRDEIEKKNQLKKASKAKEIMIKINTNINWHDTFNFLKGRHETPDKEKEKWEEKNSLEPNHWVTLHTSLITRKRTVF